MRAHLIDTDDPLTAGQDQDAICGKTVSKAQFVFFFEIDFFGAPLGMSTLLFCRKCTDCFRGIINPGRYLYGMVDGETAKQAEIEP